MKNDKAKVSRKKEELIRTSEGGLLRRTLPRFFTTIFWEDKFNFFAQMLSDCFPASLPSA